MHLEEFIKNVGYVGLLAIVFAESGLFFGFFFPGDSLIFTAGFLASQGFFDILPLVVLLAIAAISGDSVGYWFGRKTGKKIFNREDSLLFHKRNLIAANNFYKKHGGKTIILARFIPAVRTFAPIVAGAADMHYPTFLSYNVFGGLFWVMGMGLGGYFLGKSIPNVDRYLLPIIALIIFLSVLPGILHLVKDKESREQIKGTLLKVVKNLGEKKK